MKTQQQWFSSFHCLSFHCSSPEVTAVGAERDGEGGCSWQLHTLEIACGFVLMECFLLHHYWLVPKANNWILMVMALGWNKSEMTVMLPALLTLIFYLTPETVKDWLGWIHLTPVQPYITKWMSCSSLVLLFDDEVETGMDWWWSGNWIFKKVERCCCQEKGSGHHSGSITGQPRRGSLCTPFPACSHVLIGR